MLLTGILLVSGIGVTLLESPGYWRGRFDSAFWKLPLDDKLDHVAARTRHWWWISIWSLVGLFLMSGGLAGLTWLLADQGEAELAFVAYGAYLVTLIAWVFGSIVQPAAVAQAAGQRAETGATPAWIHGFWDAGYLAEGVWVIGSNLAYALFGVAILQSGVTAPWAGWVALVAGLLIPLLVALSRFGFPQLGEVIPFVIGVAVIITSI